MISAAGRWEQLGVPAPTALTDARLQLHHGAQIANSVSISFLPPAPDDSHTNFEWLAEARMLATRVIPAPRPFRVGLRPYDFTLLVVDGSGRGQNGIPLHGRTVTEAFGWLTAQVRAAGADVTRLTMQKHYEIPRHAVGDGATFEAGNIAAFRELGRWWANLDGALRALAGRTPGTGDVRCWPHHFDLATLVSIPASGGKSIGVGLSSGDEWYSEPYLYVSPHPAPSDRSRAPQLDGDAHWHTEHWFGAVLRGSTIVANGPGAQGACVDGFIDSAIGIVRQLLDA